MRIYIANDGETLRAISKKTDVELEEILLLNPNIADPDLNIKDLQVKLSSEAVPISRQLDVPYFPPSTAPPEFMDNWIPLTSLDEMEKTDYDVLIVGSGAGGGAMLWRLCMEWGNNGKRIGVVEAGDLALQTHAYNIPTLGNQRWGSYFVNPRISRPSPTYGSTEVFALGGRTLFWLGVSPRMHVSETSGWPITANEMEMYYNIAERVMNVTTDFTKGSSITQISLDRLRADGFPDAIDQPIATDLQPTKYGEIHSNVFFSSLSFFGAALNKRPFDLAVKTRAVQVVTEKGKAAGVIVMSSDKNPHFLKAKTVVLSAGSFQSTRILLNSDIQGTALGHYLTSHSRVYGAGVVERAKFPELLGTLGILIPGKEERPYQMQIIGPGNYQWYLLEEQPLKDKWPVYFHASGKVESRYENRVELDLANRDPYGIPELKVHFSYSGKDERVINLMAKAVEQASSAMQATLVAEGSRPKIGLWHPGQELHEMSTCRMGDNPSTSTTNRYGQVHGIPGLYVADNGIIPTSGTANPTLTTVALSIRTADYIMQQLK